VTGSPPPSSPFPSSHIPRKEPYEPAPREHEQHKLDTGVAHTARMWNYWLGGKDNFAVDRELADKIRAVVPSVVSSARADRAFLGRVVRYLVTEAGIRQFLDIGTGLPTANNTHEVAQALAPECRIVYVDNDPMVLAHARALLTSTPQGATDYIDADARDIDAIVHDAARTIDFDQPVAVTLLGILNFVGDDAQARRITGRLVDAIASGSHVAVAHPTFEGITEAGERAMRLWNANAQPPVTVRTKAEIARFLDGLELLEPGIVACSRWRPDPDDPESGAEVYQLCGVGRKS
jgi:O-methyltransferase involved in polyketide biosynthesis